MGTAGAGWGVMEDFLEAVAAELTFEVWSWTKRGGKTCTHRRELSGANAWEPPLPKPVLSGCGHHAHTHGAAQQEVLDTGWDRETAQGGRGAGSLAGVRRPRVLAQLCCTQTVVLSWVSALCRSSVSSQEPTGV